MNTEQQILCEILQRQTQAFERLAMAVERLSPIQPDSAPNYQFALEKFIVFDWSSIGAEVEKSDNHGAAIVNWRGHQFIRRSPTNKFGEAIWFSRCIGKDDSGENQYARLCTFKQSRKVDPLPDKVQQIAYSNRQPSSKIIQ